MRKALQRIFQSSTRSTKIFILLFRGAPPDYPRYRHAALFFRFSNGAETTMHITGTHGSFEFEENPEYVPWGSRGIMRIIPVAEVPDSIDPLLITGIVSRTPIRDVPQDADWNCQNWVCDALDRLVINRCLSVEQKSAAIERMRAP
jgi:hypothetical protein